MIAILAIFCSAALATSTMRQPINTDSIQTIVADGQRAHVISAEMTDGSSIPLLRNKDGMLWLGDVSHDHKWFMTKNLNWNLKKKNCAILICRTSTVECKCQDVVADSGFSFDRFLDDGNFGFQLIGGKRTNGKFPKKIFPIDSFETRFNIELNKRVKP